MGKWIKKLQGTPLTRIAQVIDNLNVTTNSRTNAPSIRAVREAFENKWETIYPIGSVYISVSSEFDPSIAFGGTWQQIKDRFLLSSGDTYISGNTGGSATNTLSVNNLPSHSHSYTRATGVGNHTLTASEIPSHDHTITTMNADTSLAGGGVDPIQYFNGNGSQTVTINKKTTATGGGGAHNHPLNTDTPNTGNTGSGQAVNNMPPYLVVNVWVRTA